VNKKILMGVGLAASVFGAPGAFAELADPPYFNLWTPGEVKAGLTGNGTTVALCGTSACNGTISTKDYAIFSVEPPNTGAGSGNIDPFLRFQHNEGAGNNGSTPTEAAYNTNFRGSNPQDTGSISGLAATTSNQAKDSNAFNHVIKFSDLAIDSEGYISFLLDINEPGADKQTLRLDELALFVSDSDKLNLLTADLDGENNGKLATAMLSDTNSATEKVAKVWDMDFNTTANGTPLGGGQNYGGLNLTSINEAQGANGSGDFDMRMKVSADLFKSVMASAGLGDDAYVYLYNFAGQADSKNDGTEAEAGFEEWAAEVTYEVPPDNGVPEPSTALLLFGGLAGMLKIQRQRKTSQTSA